MEPGFKSISRKSFDDDGGISIFVPPISNKKRSRCVLMVKSSFGCGFIVLFSKEREN